MGTITWTDESERWLEDIFEYIAIDDSSAASWVVNDIHERAQVLKTHPEIGYRYQPALCYNLPKAPEPGEANAEYTERLRAVLRKLDFLPEHVESVS